ncbi:hypothetical protein [Halococcus sp. PRR34]|uniref:hypothetical protein n=1 Tax=Halococcus sp. PRR34 TaxID=3020830 RepID=UPI00235FFE18|nr:hypothetical protein [Halococcus sp. PRR34]
MTDTPYQDEYQYDEPIPEPVGVELNTSNDELSEEFDASKEIKIEDGTELKRLLSTFGDDIDISERIEFAYNKKKLIIDADRGMELESPKEIKTFLMGVNEILFGADLISERTYEVNILTMDKAAFTSSRINGYEHHKKVEEWETHEDIEDPEEYDEYVTALANRMFANMDSSAPHGPVMDVNDVAIGVRERRYSLEEAKERMNQIGASEELREP